MRGTDAGIIDERCSYTRNSFLAAAGLTRSAFTAAVRGGLRTRKVGKRTFILGRDWLQFLEQQSAESKEFGIS